MSRGLATTLDLLTTTRNESAVDLLIAALDSSRPDVRLAALRGLMARPAPRGHREILRRVPRIDGPLRAAFADGAGFMEPALRLGLTGEDWKDCFAASQIALWAREYDLLPTLLGLMPPGRGASERPQADLSRAITLQLAELLWEELHRPGKSSKRRDPQACRGRSVACLESWLRQAGPQPCEEVVEAYLMLSLRDDAGLRQILYAPRDQSQSAVLAVLGRSRRQGVMRLLASFIDDPHPPRAALQLISARSDLEFVACLLGRLGDAPSPAVGDNLRRIDSLPWATPAQGTLDALDGDGQRRAVTALLATALAEAAKLAAIEHLAHRGHPAARRAAVAALAGVRSPEATQLVLQAVTSDDPEVQAAALAQLRPRDVPRAIPLLVERIHSPHEAVRRAVRESLSEFRFERYMAGFDALSEEVRRTTGRLVKQIDPEAVARLRTEMASPSRLRRIRGIQMAQAMDAAGELEHELIARLDDEDYLVRTEAGRALAACDTPTARAALLLHQAGEAVSSSTTTTDQSQVKTVATAAARLPARPNADARSEPVSPSTGTPR